MGADKKIGQHSGPATTVGAITLKHLAGEKQRGRALRRHRADVRTSAPIWHHLLQHRGVHSCRPASSTFAAAERHDRIGGQPAGGRASHPLKAARFDSALTNLSQEGSTVFGDFKIHLATGLYTEAIPHLLRDGHLALARYRYSHYCPSVIPNRLLVLLSTGGTLLLVSCEVATFLPVLGF